jgi:hypothetical protein
MRIRTIGASGAARDDRVHDTRTIGPYDRRT